MSMSLPSDHGPRAQAVRARVLGDVIPGGLARDVTLVVGGAALTALAAQVAVPLPFTPVPITLQTFAVLLVGASLGTVRGFASILLYLAVGVAGAPIFSGGSSGMGGASFGYVIGFVLAAALVGRLAERGATRGTLATAGIMIAGNLAVYAVGVPWLMAEADVGLGKGLALGFVPFVIGDLIKVAVAAGLFPTTWRLLGRR